MRTAPPSAAAVRCFCPLPPTRWGVSAWSLHGPGIWPGTLSMSPMRGHADWPERHTLTTTRLSPQQHRLPSIGTCTTYNTCLALSGHRRWECGIAALLRKRRRATMIFAEQS